VALPDERNFRCVDMESSTYKNRLKPIPQVLQILEHFGFKHSTQKNIYLEVEKPDVSQMEAGVNDLILIIRQLGSLTPIYKSLRKFIRIHGLQVATFVVEKLLICLNKIVATPEEAKYHKIKLDKFFSKVQGNGVVERGYDLFRLFGFKVDIATALATLPYDHVVDLSSEFAELFKLRVQDLDRAFKQLSVQKFAKYPQSQYVQQIQGDAARGAAPMDVESDH